MKEIACFRGIFMMGLNIDADDPIYRKVLLLNILLIVSIVVLSFFAFYNLFYDDEYYLGLIDITTAMVVLYSLYEIKSKLNIKRASLIATINMFVFMVALVYTVEGKDFTLVWTIFFPIFMIFINGSKKGGLVTLLFYLVVFSIAYSGIGEWQEGLWNTASFSRFVGASLGLTFVTFVFERSFENANHSIEINRIREENYIKKLELTSITDPLTELYNRRYLAVQFKLKYAKSQEYQSYFALFIMDIDFFKAYNDTYGHIAGDKALQDVANVLKNSMKRESDSTFRVGGEEFCGLIIANEQHKISGTIENIRKSIKHLNIEHTGSELGILTASFGVCVINSYENENLDAMYKIADTALYKAKENGRNNLYGGEITSTI